MTNTPNWTRAARRRVSAASHLQPEPFPAAEHTVGMQTIVRGVIVYAPQSPPFPAPVAAPVAVRLIGVLDAALIAAFGALERGLVGAAGATVLIDVRDVSLLGEGDMDALAGVVAGARREGRDVRLDARSLAWKRVAKKILSAQPLVDAQLRSAVRRTVILAHSARYKRR